MAFYYSSLLSLRLPHHHYRHQLSVQSPASVTILCRISPFVAPASSIELKQVSLATSWRENQGSTDWETLIKPLNPILRDKIVRYGELTLTCYKAFELDPTSDHYLNCKYNKTDILEETGLATLGYKVTKYIYATPDSKYLPRWIGYVAISSDQEVAQVGRRDVVVSFRGTVTAEEWKANLMFSLRQARFSPFDPRPEVKVQSGFLSLYTSESTCRFNHGSCRQQLQSEISRILNKYKDSDTELSITLAGHSMGSSLALLLGYDLAELCLNGEVPITVYSFGGPRVGNSEFKKRCEELRLKVLRIVNVNDPVTKLPGVILNENFRVCGGWYKLPCYAHVGVEVTLEGCFKMKNPACIHDLDVYLGLLKNPETKILSGSDILGELIDLLIARITFDASWWTNVAARNMKNLMQSIRICGIKPWRQKRR